MQLLRTNAWQRLKTDTWLTTLGYLLCEPARAISSLQCRSFCYILSAVCQTPVAKEAMCRKAAFSAENAGTGMVRNHESVCLKERRRYHLRICKKHGLNPQPNDPMVARLGWNQDLQLPILLPKSPKSEPVLPKQIGKIWQPLRVVVQRQLVRAELLGCSWRLLRARVALRRWPSHQ